MNRLIVYMNRLHRIMHSIFTARLILNIRKAAAERNVSIGTREVFTLPTNFPSNQMVEMDFLTPSETGAEDDIVVEGDNSKT